MNLLNEKIDYSKDPEAPISLGMKLLKKIEKEWGRDADIYDAIENIVISADVKYPKQMALRLKRTLENYDMWEAPYKGLVNKIQKWQFVNENLAAIAAPIIRGAATAAAYKLADRAADTLGDKFDSMVNGSTNESDLDSTYDNDTYFSPRDVKELIQKAKIRGSKLTKFEAWVIEAANWARSRDTNYQGYSKRIPAVEYIDGKFYVSTIHDGFTEVPFNYNVVTPEWLGLTESECPKSGCIKKKPNGKWGIISAKTGKFWKANYDSKKDAEDGLKAYHVNESDNNSEEVYMIVYANDNFDINDIKKFIIIFKDDIVYEDDERIEFYTADWQDIQDELDVHGIEWEEDRNY